MRISRLIQKENLCLNHSLCLGVCVFIHLFFQYKPQWVSHAHSHPAKDFSWIVLVIQLNFGQWILSISDTRNLLIASLKRKQVALHSLFPIPWTNLNVVQMSQLYLRGGGQHPQFQWAMKEIWVSGHQVLQNFLPFASPPTSGLLLWERINLHFIRDL